MPNPTPLRLVAILALGLAAADPAAAEGPPRPKIRALELAKFAKSVAGYADKLELLDDLTEAKSETRLGGADRAEPEGAYFVAAYRVSDLELSKGLTNRIWLLGDVPGRGLETSIRTDCLMHEWYTVPGKARDRSDPTTLLIRLAPARLMTEFPDDVWVKTDLSAFRFEALGDGDKAQALRLELYEEARELALARYREFRMAGDAGLAEEMRAEFQTLHPTKRVRVDRDPRGLVVGIDGYFASESSSPAAPDSSTPWLLAGLAAGIAFGLAIALLLRIRTPRAA